MEKRGVLVFMAEFGYEAVITRVDWAHPVTG